MRGEYREEQAETDGEGPPPPPRASDALAPPRLDPAFELPLDQVHEQLIPPALSLRQGM